MSSITLEEAKNHLAEIIDNLKPNEEIVITKDNQPVARLMGSTLSPKEPRRPGTLKGTVLYIAPDFDAPLEDFKEYME
jgi:prevent-host-death family protein